MDEVLHVKYSVIVDYNAILLKSYSKDEIYAAARCTHAIFYQQFWHIIRDEVFKFVSNMLHNYSSSEYIKLLILLSFLKLSLLLLSLSFDLSVYVMCCIKLPLKLLCLD